MEATVSEQAFLDGISERVGSDALLTPASADLAAYAEDWRGRYRGEALCVVLPSSTAEVAAVVRHCVAHRIPVIPQGGNTSLCGGAVPAESGPRPVIVNLARMRRVRAIDAANNSIVVDAGCVLANVQQAAADAGRLYPVSLGAEGSCQVGGTIATNAGGTSVLRYGNTRENVLGLEVVLPDGSVWDGLYALRKNNTGLDLKHLFIGSEGTMGIITAACLKLHPLPSTHATAWTAPADPVSALALLGLCQQQCGATLSAFEMINERQLALVTRHVPGRKRPLADAHPWHVLIELADTGASQALAEALQSVLEQASARGLLRDAAIAASEAQRSAFWQVRHSVSEANKKAGIGLTTDCAVPVSNVPPFIEQASAEVNAFLPAAEVVIVAHLGDGNVHFIPLLSFETWNAVPDRDSTAREIRRRINDVAHRLGGTFSAEHGIGRTSLDEMAHYKPAVELEMMRTVKLGFDPANLFNPGRLLPAPPEQRLPDPGRSADSHAAIRN